MRPKTEKLIKVLDQLVEILNIDNDLHWKNWFKQANERLMTSDFSGIEKVLSAYGGMGSFNDFYLGDKASSKKKFNKLRAKAWVLLYLKRLFIGSYYPYKALKLWTQQAAPLSLAYVPSQSMA